ncbi:MFS transporter [Jatrophihabitans sp. DSM 45814]
MEGTRPTAGSRRWLILALGLFAQAATCSFLYGLPMLVPQFRTDLHLSLPVAGAVVGAPALGLLLTLIAWGALADRYGERWIIVSGLALAAIFLLWATQLASVLALCIALVLAGASAASVNAASGRMVLGWFAAHERGLAMGIRQTGQPLGVAFAALVLPPVAQRWGLGPALAIPAVTCAVLAVLVAAFALDPPRPAMPTTSGATTSGATTSDTARKVASPYRVPTLWRLHAASTMLVVPQFAVSGFSMIYLVGVRHWDATDAGRLLFFAQVLGAFGRIGSGVWSDRVGSRLRPMRQLAVASAAVMVAAALCDRISSPVVIVVLVLGAVITVADNGLAFTSVAEIAGSSWAGRALGAQNTAQNIAATLTPPLLGALISAHGYALGFAIAAIFPLLAIALTPVGDERRFAAAQSRSEPIAGTSLAARARPSNSSIAS